MWMRRRSNKFGESMGQYAMTSKQQHVINVIKSKGQITRHELSCSLNVTYMCAHYYLKRLQKFGVISSVIQGRERYYSIDERKLEIVKMNSPTKILRRYIERHPGMYFLKLSEVLQISVGTLGRRLTKLEKEKKIMATFDGHTKRFYPEGMTVEEMPLPLSPSQVRVFNVIARNPGTTCIEIALALGITKRTIYYHIKNLIEMEAISAKMIENTKHLYAEESVKV